MMESTWCAPWLFAFIDLRAQLMCGPGIRDNRRRCLGGAPRSFLRLGVGIHSLGGLGVRGSR